MQTIFFSVPGIPIAQPRQRQRIVSTGGHQFASNYTPKGAPVNVFKAAVQMAASVAYDGAPHAGPTRIAVLFVLPRPQGMCWKKKPTPRALHCGKPDVDNLLKSLIDALSGLVFVDDARIHSATIEKVIAAADEQPHCEVTISFSPAL